MPMYAIMIENKLEPTIYGSLKHLCTEYSIPYRTALGGNLDRIIEGKRHQITEVKIIRHTRVRSKKQLNEF